MRLLKHRPTKLSKSVLESISKLELLAAPPVVPQNFRAIKNSILILPKEDEILEQDIQDNGPDEIHIVLPDKYLIDMPFYAANVLDLKTYSNIEFEWGYTK